MCTHLFGMTVLWVEHSNPFQGLFTVPELDGIAPSHRRLGRGLSGTPHGHVLVDSRYKRHGVQDRRWGLGRAPARVRRRQDRYPNVDGYPHVRVAVPVTTRRRSYWRWWILVVLVLPPHPRGRRATRRYSYGCHRIVRVVRVRDEDVVRWRVSHVSPRCRGGANRLMMVMILVWFPTKIIELKIIVLKLKKCPIKCIELEIIGL